MSKGNRKTLFLFKNKEDQESKVWKVRGSLPDFAFVVEIHIFRAST